MGRSSIFQLKVSKNVGANNNNTVHLTNLVGLRNLSVRLLSIEFYTTQVIIDAMDSRLMRIESNFRPDYGYQHILFLASHSSSSFSTNSSPSFEIPQDGRISLNIVQDIDGTELAEFDAILTFSADFNNPQ
jgi:hypothetical protein